MKRQLPSNTTIGGVVLPTDLANESQVIAAVVADAARSAKTVDTVDPSLFRDDAHAAIWRVLRDQSRRKILYDRTAALRALSTASSAQKVLTDIDAVASGIPWETIRLPARVRALAEDAVRRRAAEGPIADIVRYVVDPTVGLDRIQGAALSLIETVRGGGGDVVPASDAIRSYQADLARRDGQMRYGLGLEGIDSVLGEGFAPRRTTVISAETGHGKSAAALTLALAMARQGRRVLYLCWEEDEIRIMDKIASSEAGIPYTQVVRKDMTAAEERRAVDAVAGFVGPRSDGRPLIQFGRNPFLGIWLEAKGRLYQQDAMRKIQSMILDSGADVVIYDMWERAVLDGSVHSVEKSLEAVQHLHRELDVHGILVAQMHMERARTMGADKAAVKGVKRIVEISDLFMILTRLPPGRDGVEYIDMKIAKQRVGVPVTVRWTWEGEYQRISSPAVVRERGGVSPIGSDGAPDGGEDW